MRHFNNILSSIFVCTLASCSADNAFLPDTGDANEMGRVEFSLQDNTTRAATTTLTKEEAGEFWITIFKGSDLSKDRVQLKDFDNNLAAGYGYVAVAENCDKQTATAANDGWGQRRFYGSSDLFAIKIGETTKVGISCSVVNAGIEILFDQSVPQYFTNSYKVTVDDGERSVVFDSETAGFVNGEEVTGSKTAYFNVDEDGVSTLNYIIEAYGEGIKLLRTRSLALAKSTISRLKFTFVPGSYDLDIQVQNEDMYVEQNVDITYNDVTQDDGSADLDSSHDNFEESDGDVDINDYN